MAHLRSTYKIEPRDINQITYQNGLWFDIS